MTITNTSCSVTFDSGTGVAMTTGTNKVDLESDVIRAALHDVFGAYGISLGSEVRRIERCAGELLCEVGDPANTAWLVVSGRLLACTLDPDGTEQALGIVGPGELIGESSLLDDGRRGARVRALRGSQLVVLDRTWLAEQLARSPDTAIQLVRTMVTRSCGDRRNRPESSLSPERCRHVPNGASAGGCRARSVAGLSVDAIRFVDPPDRWPQTEG